MHLMQVAIQSQLILGDPQRVLLELLCVIFHLQVLLEFVLPFQLTSVNHQNYTQMLKLLMSEAKVIKAKKMSSTFAITQIKTNSNQLG